MTWRGRNFGANLRSDCDGWKLRRAESYTTTLWWRMHRSTLWYLTWCVSKIQKIMKFKMDGNVHYDEAMSNLTTSKDPTCCLFGGRKSCVDKQSVKGDRTTTPAWKGCSKQMLVRIIRSFLPTISRNRLKCGFLKLLNETLWPQNEIQ